MVLQGAAGTVTGSMCGYRVPTRGTTTCRPPYNTRHSTKYFPSTAELAMPQIKDMPETVREVYNLPDSAFIDTENEDGAEFCFLREVLAVRSDGKTQTVCEDPRDAATVLHDVKNSPVSGPSHLRSYPLETAQEFFDRQRETSHDHRV